MQWFVVAVVFASACDREQARPQPAVTPQPSDPSVSLEGSALEQFCRNQSVPEACSRFANCELSSHGCEGAAQKPDRECLPYSECVPKQKR